MVVISSYREMDFPRELSIFLKNEFALSDDAINLGKKHSYLEAAPLPIILWNFGLISLSQYERVLDWIDDNL